MNRIRFRFACAAWLLVALLGATTPLRAAVAYVAASASSLSSSAVGSVAITAPAGS